MTRQEPREAARSTNSKRHAMQRALVASMAAVALALAGCIVRVPQASVDGGITPAQAIQLAAANPLRGVSGRFPMKVRAAGRSELLHLNSETDYRDQRNVTITVLSAAEAGLATRLGKPPIEAMVGRDIVVSGRARRVRIVFYSDGKPTDKYYYQTHVVVSDADQIALR